MLSFGFVSISSKEIRQELRQSNRRPPRPRKGREVGFVFGENELKVYVWTTWLEAESEAREEDAGWVLIVKGEKILYSSHPIHRTKHFLDTLLAQARIARIRVKCRPKCWKCGEFMAIISGKALKTRYWYCGRLGHHKDNQSTFCSWDAPLLPGMKLYVKILRHKRAKYRKKLAAEGKVVTPAVLTRKRW